MHLFTKISMKHHIGRTGFSGVRTVPLLSPQSSEGPCAWYNALLSPSSLVGFPGSDACNAGNSGSILGLGRSPGEENGNPLQCFFPEESHGQKEPGGL